MQFLAGNAGRLAEMLKLSAARPGIVCRGGVNLVELPVDAETKILIEPFKITGRLHGRGNGAGVMVPLMNPGLIDVGRPPKRRPVTFQNQDGLSSFGTEKSGIEAI